MPKKTVKSPIDSLINKAIVAHKDDDVKAPSGGDLPDGIEGGIAKLVDLVVGKYKSGDMQGKQFFRAAGIVVSPATIKNDDGTFHIKGLRTQIMEPLCETPNRSRKTIDEHVAWILNQIKLLGGEECVADVSTFNDLKELMSELVKDEIYFSFRTWKGEPSKEFPNPRVNHEWRGAIDFDDEESDDEIEEMEVDDDEEEDEAEDDVEEPDEESGEEEDEDEPEESEDDTSSDEEDVPFGDDLDMLADKADNEQDGEAVERLTELAMESGFTEDEINDIASWNELVEAMRASNSEEGEDDEESEEEEEESNAPEKGDEVQYKPKGKRKPVTVTVTAVFEGTETCNVKDEASGKVYRKVKWDELT